MRLKMVLSAAACAAFAGSAFAGDNAIGTLDVWDGVQSIGSFGETNTATYGQTFTADINTTMTGFTFFQNDSLNSDFVEFEAYVYEWDAGSFMATGGALHASGPYTTTNNGGADGFEQFTIGVDVDVTAGTQYIAFFSASNLFDGEAGTSTWGLVDDEYAGGGFVFMNNGDQFGDLFANSWTDWGGGDLAFEVTFIPAPGALGLLGVAGLVGTRRRRR